MKVLCCGFFVTLKSFAVVFAAVAVGAAICNIRFFNSSRVSYRFDAVAFTYFNDCVRVASTDIISSFCVVFRMEFLLPS